MIIVYYIILIPIPILNDYSRINVTHAFNVNLHISLEYQGLFQYPI